MPDTTPDEPRDTAAEMLAEHHKRIDAFQEAFTGTPLADALRAAGATETEIGDVLAHARDIVDVDRARSGRPALNYDNT